MSQRRITIISGTIEHPCIDTLISIIAIVIWWCVKHPVPELGQSPNDLFIGLSTLAGLIMAAATFICTMTYQSENTLMRTVRKRYGKSLSKNWQSIIAWLLADAALPLLSISIWCSNKEVAFGFSLFASINLAEKAIRSLFWLNYTLFMNESSEQKIHPYTEMDFKREHLQ